MEYLNELIYFCCPYCGREMRENVKNNPNFKKEINCKCNSNFKIEYKKNHLKIKNL